MKVKYASVFFFGVLTLILVVPFLSSAETQKYYFDDLDRLEYVQYPDNTIVHYSYDSAGNRLRKEFLPVDPIAIALSANLPSPQNPGTVITFTATGSGGFRVSYEYRFWLHDETSWSMVQDYGVGSTWSLPASTPAGDYTIAVDVRTNTAVYRDAVSYLPYQIATPAPPATGVDITPDHPSPHPAGTSVQFTASGIGSSGYQYRFWLFDGTNWSMVQDYGAGATWSLPSSTPVGDYTIAVDVRTSTVVYRDTVTYLAYQIQ